MLYLYKQTKARRMKRNDTKSTNSFWAKLKLAVRKVLESCAAASESPM